MVILCAIGSWWGVQVLERVEKARPDIRWEPVYQPARLPLVVQERQPRQIHLLNWSERVSEAIWTCVPTINYHCAPLPYGRGGHPIENLILAGHTETVITAHEVTGQMDAGPIYGVSAPISLAGTKEQIRERFIEPVSELLLQIVDGTLQPKAQEGEATYFTRLPKDEYRAFWEGRA